MEPNGSDQLDRCLEVAVAAAQQAGEVIAKAFNAAKRVEEKASNVDLVTETDQQCETLVRKTLSDAFPDFEFIGEEESSKGGFTLTDKPTWMVDPLDGTTNFVHRFPFVCVSIGLAISKKAVVGVVYNPIMNELFTAVRGKGAFLNGQPIKVSAQTELGRALVATEIGIVRDEAAITATTNRIKALMLNARSIRCAGSCALNLSGIACGRLDAYYEFGIGGPWDAAAGAVILTEAGGDVIDPATGGKFDLLARRVLGSNGQLSQQLYSALQSAELKQ
eukprot:jgi/Chlat1/5640/Chrsp369S00866